ncbi:MAG: hemolysin family protein [Oscillospiraceae bacterium]|nr:hemolysin family protein [Oscillospiraceae bacterium]
MASDPIGPQLLLQLVLIFINAFFASAEIAVLSLNENRLRRKAEEGDKKAAQMMKFVETPAKFLSTIQIGITMAGFLGSAFAAENFADRLTRWLVDIVHVTTLSQNVLHALSVIVITFILAYFTLVLGELVPKRLAMKYPEKVARMASGVIRGTSVVFKPLIWLLSISTNGILCLLHIDPNEERSDVSEDEIRLMVDIGEEKGTIESSERTMIENVFAFNNMTAEDVMIHRTDMKAIWVEDTPEEIVNTIERTGLSRFPVYEEDADDIIGILSTRQYLLNAHRGMPKPLREILRPAYFVPESVRTDILFRDMQTKKVHMAIVVDEYGGTSGLVTMEDLLEEIVGNIYDEFDPQDEQDIIKIEDNLWRIAGSTELENVAETLDILLPLEEEYDTLGGLVFAQLSVIPEDGTQITVDACGLHIHVKEIAERRVEWALVSKLPEQTQEEEETK